MDSKARIEMQRMVWCTAFVRCIEHSDDLEAAARAANVFIAQFVLVDHLVHKSLMPHDEDCTCAACNMGGPG